MYLREVTCDFMDLMKTSGSEIFKKIYQDSHFLTSLGDHVQISRSWQLWKSKL